MDESKEEVEVVDILVPEKSVTENEVTQAPLSFLGTDGAIKARSVDIHDMVVRHPDSTFFMRVEGKSMEAFGIFDSDILVVDRSLTLTGSHNAVLVLDGEMVVKRIERLEENAYQLLSEANEEKPIASESFELWGVVTGSVRTFS